MYQSLYADTLSDTAERARMLERQAFERAVALLERAEATGSESRASVEALLFLSRLWSILMEDLAGEANGLPPKLRASLISIGIWSLRHAEDIRQGRSLDYRALIDVTRTLSTGLGQD